MGRSVTSAPQSRRSICESAFASRSERLLWLARNFFEKFFLANSAFQGGKIRVWVDMIDVWTRDVDDDYVELCQRCLVRPVPQHVTLVICIAGQRQQCCSVCYRALCRCARCGKRGPLSQSPPDAVDALWCLACHATWSYWYNMSAKRFAATR